MKLSFGEGGAKGFLAEHCEKIVAVVVAIVSALFIYSGFNEEGLDKTKDPSVLHRDAENALNHVNNTDAVANLMKDFDMRKEQYEENVERGNQPINTGSYAFSIPLKSPANPPHSKRPDPKLIPPKNALAYVVTGPLELKSAPDPLDGLDNAEAPEIEPEKPVRKPKPKRNPRNSMGMMGMDMEMEEAMAEMEEESSADMSMGMSMGMGMGANAGAAGGGWTLPDAYLETYKPGVAGPVMSMNMNSSDTSQGAGFQPVTFVMISALAPFQEQWEEFENSLMNATGYIASRDRPNYFYVQVERAEVTDPTVPVDQLQWTLLKNTTLEKFRDHWAGKVPEPTKPEHLDDYFTYPVPPVPLRDLTHLLVRDELPIKKANKNNAAAKAGDVPTFEDEEVTEEDGVIRRRKRTPANGMGMGMDMDMGMDMSSGDMESGDYEDSMNMGMGMMGMGTTPVQVVDYKLIRFFDFAVTPGKRYRYRVRLLLEDPNFPEDVKLTPNIRTLDEEASKRVRALMAKEKPGEDRKSWYRHTDWSEPTDLVYVEPRRKMLGGQVAAGEMKRIRRETGQDITIQWTEPVGKFMPVLWNRKLASDVPGETEVKRGSVLNFKQDVAVPHPLTNILKSVKEHQFKTNAFVVDIRGGDQLPNSPDPKDPLIAPGEFAVVDTDGNLIVRNELDDVEEYRRYTYQDDSRKPKPAAATMDDEEMEMQPFGIGDFDYGN